MAEENNVPSPQSSVEISKPTKGIKTYSVKVYNKDQNTALSEAQRLSKVLDDTGEFPKS